MIVDILLTLLVRALVAIGGIFVYSKEESEQRRAVAETIALSLVTTAYARHTEGERFSEQMDAIYHRWHFGEWPSEE